MIKFYLTLIFFCSLVAHSHAQKQPVVIDSGNRHLISIRFMMHELDRERTVRVFLPSSYYTSAKQRYPVIYMHDGQNLFLDAKNKADKWAIDSVINSYPKNKQAIVVGINSSGKHRITEYNPYNSIYGGPPEGQPYLRFITNELKPYIDAHYRTKPAPQHTVMGGSSMGGLISMYAASQMGDIFGTVCILSPAYFMGDGIYNTVTVNPLLPHVRIFQACGDQEGNEIDYVMKMDSVFRRQNLSIKRAPKPMILAGAQHNEKQWRTTFAAFYKWFANQ